MTERRPAADLSIRTYGSEQHIAEVLSSAAGHKPLAVFCFFYISVSNSSERCLSSKIKHSALYDLSVDVNV